MATNWKRSSSNRFCFHHFWRSPASKIYVAGIKRVKARRLHTFQSAWINDLFQRRFSRIAIDQADIRRQLLHSLGYTQFPFFIWNGNDKAFIRLLINTLSVPCKYRMILRYRDVSDIGVLFKKIRMKRLSLNFGNGRRNMDRLRLRTAKRIGFNYFYSIWNCKFFARRCGKNQRLILLLDQTIFLTRNILLFGDNWIFFKDGQSYSDEF